MNKKRLLIISQFSEGPQEGGNDRFNYICNILCEQMEVTLAISSFSHIRKQQREVVYDRDKQYKYVYIFEPGYKKNVGLGRFYSHYIYGKYLNKYLREKDRFDAIYCAIPSLDAGAVAARYCKEKKIPFIVDIQDLWPEAYKMVFNVPLVSNALFRPFEIRANSIYRAADEIVAVSNTYLNRAKRVSKKTSKGLSVYLGTDLKKFDICIKGNIPRNKNDDRLRVAYVGTLGNSYDIINIIDSLALVSARGIRNVEFIIMGDGPLRGIFEKHARTKNVNAVFKGRMDYCEMARLLATCDIAVNPIKDNSAASIINKHADYAAASLPVINTQDTEEYRLLLKTYEAGFTCPNNAGSIAEKIEILSKDSNLRLQMGKNGRKMAEDLFDRRVTYQSISRIVIDAVNKGVDSGL